MAQTFEIHGEVATDVTRHPRGGHTLILETSNDLEELHVPPIETDIAVTALSTGDRVAVEVERVGAGLVVHGLRPTYVRGFPGLR